MAVSRGDIENYILPQEPIIRSFIYDYRDFYAGEERLIQFIEKITALDRKCCEFMVEESRENNIDPFILLGLLKRESDFNPNAKGSDGERGLGQLMEATAKIISENLGYVYSPDMLLEPEYNLKLTITQLSYLQKVYDNMHMALTAYNRGQQGLINYMEATGNKTGQSDYSTKVLLFAAEYEEAFEKFNN